MQLYWKDEYDYEERWTHLEIEVTSADSPQVRLYAGAGKKFKLQRGEYPILWGCIEEDWYGAWVLRNENHWEVSEMIVPPVKSQEIEPDAFQHPDEKWAHWSRYFLDALRSSDNSPLYEGSWQLSKANHRYTMATKRGAPGCMVYDSDLAFRRGRPHHVDWGINGSQELVAIKTMPDSDSGRVKWYRKLVDQGTCPPVLVWFMRCLDAYIILDGHCRLKAFLDKEVMPEILVLAGVKKIPVGTNASRQKSLIASLERRSQNARKQPVPLEKENWLLIEAFDDSPFITPQTKSKGIPNFEPQWDKEVAAFEHVEGIDIEALADMCDKPSEDEIRVKRH